jgi:hypothetical protein
MSDKVVEPEIEHAGETHTKPISRFTRWYRSPLFNVIIVGLISFTQPGIWNALNSKLASSYSPLPTLQYLTIARCRCRGPTRALSCQWCQLFNLRHHGLRLFFLRHSRQQDRSQNRLDPRYSRLRTIQRQPLCQQSLRYGVVRTFRRCNMRHCCFGIVGI